VYRGESCDVTLCMFFDTSSSVLKYLKVYPFLMMMLATATVQPNIKALTSELWKNAEEYIMFRIAKRVQELTPSLTERGLKPLMLSMGAPTGQPPRALKDALIEALDQTGMHTYSTPRGELYFREAVAQRMQQRFGVTVDPNKEVFSLVGSKEGLANMFRGLITPNLDPQAQDIILAPDPGYASYVDSIQGAGGRAFPIALTPENNYTPDMNTVLEQVKAAGLDPKRIKAVIVNYPSNPLGAMCDLAYYEHVVAFCRTHNYLLISDNAYADLYFEGSPVPNSVLEVEGAKDIAIEFHSLSKPYCTTGWRIGFAVGNPDAIQLLGTVKSTVDSGLFKVMQKAGAFALLSHECEAFVKEANAQYAKAHELTFNGFVQTLGWPAELLRKPQATFYFWLPIPPRYTNCQQFTTELLEQAGIVAVPGTAFGQYGEGFVRLSIVLPLEQLQEMIDRMLAKGFTYQGTAS
jgi:LL-diaminopimelate aminotransferase